MADTEMGAVGVEAREPVVSSSKREEITLFSGFTLMGCASLLLWNAILSTIGEFNGFYGDTVADTTTATCMTLLVAITALLMYFGAARIRLIYCGLVGTVFCGLAIPLVVQTAKKDSGIALMHLICALVGVSAALIQSPGFSIASIMQPPQAGAVSFGCGAAGLLTFVLWLGIVSGMAPAGKDGKREETAVKSAMWVFFCLIAFIAVVTLVLLMYLQRSRVYQAAYRSFEERNNANVSSEARKKNSLSSTPRTQEFEDDQTARGVGKTPLMEHLHRYWFIIKKCKVPIVCVFTTFFVTLQMFPNIGPVRWNAENIILLVGLFQVGDFLGRYIPNLGANLPFVLLKEKYLVFAVFSRIGFIPLFMCFFKYGSNMPANSQSAFFASLAAQVIVMLIFSISNGWLVSLCMMYSPTHVDSPDDKATAGTITTLAFLVAIFSGLWVSKLYTL